jgi:hypothetical protein
MNYKEIFNTMKILNTETSVPWDFVYYPFWRSIRENFVKEIKSVLEEMWYEERHFNDIMKCIQY